MRVTSCGRAGAWTRTWLVLAGLIVASATGLTQQPAADEAAPGKPLPEGLRHVPADALGFVHVRVGDFLKTDIGKALLTHLLTNRDTAEMAQYIQSEIGVPLADIESVTLLMLEPAFMDLLSSRPELRRALGVPTPSFAVPPVPLEKDIMPIPVPNTPKDLPKEPEKKQEPFAVDESPVSLQPREVLQDDLVLIEQMQRHWGPLVILTSAKPVDRKKLLRRLVMPEQRPDNRAEGLFSRRETSVLFVSERSFLIGPAMELWRYTEQMGGPEPARRGASAKGATGKDAAAKGGPAARPAEPLREALALGAEPHLIVAGGQFASLKNYLLLAGRAFDGPDVGFAAGLFPLLNVSSAALTVDLGRTADVKVHLHGANAKSAALAAEAAKTGLALIDLGIERLLEDKSVLAPDEKGAVLIAGLLEKTRQAVAAATVKQEQATVHVRIQRDIDPKTITQAIAALAGEVRKAGDRTTRTNNLKQIALAMHNYHDSMKGFPPAGIRSIKNKDGKPLLSWRVAILPYIEQAPLYQQFDLDQPWDHPQNQKLIAQMPPIYVMPGVKTKEPGLTHYQVFVGPGTAFEPRKGQSVIGIRMTDILDGTSNTLMVVEAAEPVIWTKPDDLPFDPKQPLPKLGVSRDGFYAALCDGSVRFIRGNINEQTLRALITRNGGEVVPGDF